MALSALIDVVLLGLCPARDLRAASGLRHTRSSVGRNSSQGTTASISTSGSRLASRLAYRLERSKKPICAILLPHAVLPPRSYRSAGFMAIFRGALRSPRQTRLTPQPQHLGTPRTAHQSSTHTNREGTRCFRCRISPSTSSLQSLCAPLKSFMHSDVAQRHKATCAWVCDVDHDFCDPRH